MLLVPLSLLGAAVGRAQEGQGRFSLAGGMHYSSGSYGTLSTTEVLYVPLIARYEAGAYAASLTVPYVSITGNGQNYNGGVFFGSAGSKRITSAGLGDAVAMGSYTVYRGTAPFPWMDLIGLVKFGTADRKQQLGTGENDYAVQTALYQRIGSFSWFATPGYRVSGSPPGYRFHRVFFGSAGGSYAVTSTMSAGAMWSGQEPLTSPGYAQGDATAFFGWIPAAEYKGQFYVSRGLTRGSPDWSLGALVARTF